MLTLDDLKARAAAGAIDTVVVAMTGMAGQLFGKRFHAQYFLDSSAAETHAMRHYLAGQLTHASEISYFLAPYINSYKRFQSGTFAPTRAALAEPEQTRFISNAGLVGRTSIRISRSPR